jgi:hypothetical protein
MQEDFELEVSLRYTVLKQENKQQTQKNINLPLH